MEDQIVLVTVPNLKLSFIELEVNKVLNFKIVQLGLILTKL